MIVLVRRLRLAFCGPKLLGGKRLRNIPVLILKDNFTMNASHEVHHIRPLVTQVCLSVSLSAIMLLAIGGNLTVILAIARNTSLRTQVASIFIVNLALTDLGCSVLVMPFSLVSVWQGQWVFSFWCDALCFLNYCFIIASMLTLAIISVDRYIFVLHPLRYHLIMTRGRAVVLVLSTWAAALAFAVPPSGLGWVDYDDHEIICAIDWEASPSASAIAYTSCAFVICFLSPIMVMAYSYRGVFKVARRHSAQVVPLKHLAKTLSLDPTPPMTNDLKAELEQQPGRDFRRGSQASSSANAGSGKKHAVQRCSTRAIKPIMIMVTVYFICYTPFSLTKLIKVVAGHNQAVPSYVSTLASWMAFMNPACNPIIYSIVRRDFRSAFGKILPKFCFGSWGRARPSLNSISLDPTLHATNADGN